MMSSLLPAFRAVGIDDLSGVERYLQALPYARVSSPLEVLRQGQGTCSTKHACLVRVARELGHTAELLVGFFEMTGSTTPGVGEALASHGLDAVLEAHCVAQVDGRMVDITFPDGRASPGLFDIQALDPTELGRKVSLHREASDSWCSARALDPERVWAAREQAITDLSRGHLLFIGGTGMLRQAAVALSATHRVTMVSRRCVKGPWLGFSADWRRPDALVEVLRATEQGRGAPTRVVAWVHSDGALALAALGAALPSSTKLLHVRGSAASQPNSARSVLAGHAGFREVVLGSVQEGGRSRWLTHSEISQRVLDAVRAEDLRA